MVSSLLNRVQELGFEGCGFDPVSLVSFVISDSRYIHSFVSSFFDMHLTHLNLNRRYDCDMEPHMTTDLLCFEV